MHTLSMGRNLAASETTAFKSAAAAADAAAFAAGVVLPGVPAAAPPPAAPLLAPCAGSLVCAGLALLLLRVGALLADALLGLFDTWPMRAYCWSSTCTKRCNTSCKPATCQTTTSFVIASPAAAAAGAAAVCGSGPLLHVEAPAAVGMELGLGAIAAPADACVAGSAALMLAAVPCSTV